MLRERRVIDHQSHILSWDVRELLDSKEGLNGVEEEVAFVMPLLGGVNEVKAVEVFL